MATSEETFIKQYPLALEAIGQHMQAHHLPVPYAIDVNPTHDGFWIRIPTEAAQHAWLTSVIIDGETSERMPLGTRWQWDVRLPDTGIRVALIGYRTVPFLSVVPA